MKMMSKNLVDNLPVFVELNQTYKLLFVSCLLDQKKKNFYETRYIPWLDKNNWEERNQTVVLELKKKKNEKRKRKNFCSCYVEVFLIAVDLLFSEEDIKDMIDRIHSD